MIETRAEPRAGAGLRLRLELALAPNVGLRVAYRGWSWCREPWLGAWLGSGLELKTGL